MALFKSGLNIGLSRQTEIAWAYLYGSALAGERFGDYE